MTGSPAAPVRPRAAAFARYIAAEAAWFQQPVSWSVATNSFNSATSLARLVSSLERWADDRSARMNAPVTTADIINRLSWGILMSGSVTPTVNSPANDPVPQTATD